MINNLEKYTFQYILNNALNKVPETIDKREGSIIYDALAPICYEMADVYMELRKILIETSPETANGAFLDLKVLERGLTRGKPSKAIKKAEFLDTSGNPQIIEIGERFSTANADNLIYKVIDEYKESEVVIDGFYLLESETVGTIGNAYTGNLLPINYINDLGTATMSTLIIPAEDIETDESLRARYFETMQEQAFGGNIAQYRKMLKEIIGVGDVQIYPTWDGGGTVLCSVVDTDYNPISEGFEDILKETVDPVDGDGLGLAPIGHTVTITTPEPVTINVETKITTAMEVTKGQVETEIIEKIENYINDTKKEWGQASEFNTYSVNIYIAKINAEILKVDGVVNVSETKINNVESDLTLTQTSSLQEISTVGTVTVNE